MLLLLRQQVCERGLVLAQVTATPVALDVCEADWWGAARQGSRA
jgi:hypothetical protein